MYSGADSYNRNGPAFVRRPNTASGVSAIADERRSKLL
jgi:hypothetical protein